ncbi:hypothetical protein M407DRAFT_8276 [Tulasnella calospora MUT 4182]|uniref:Uncharacterized protein n=1 Tax=Tulasnella calospora MUT 4182 TaxID=1051891 RepID=A0A0C3QI80_9AGAM|nr:hypothetical protein M407DRAFT_8276 [Tulasnella calospora MUT 4182]
MAMEGPESDLLLLLEHVQYLHSGERRQFFIFTDFPVQFVDRTGASGTIQTIDATYHNIVRLNDGGHMDLDPPLDMENSQEREFREWLRLAQFPTTSIIVVIDSCHSGGFLGTQAFHDPYIRLSYIYKAERKRGDNTETATAAEITGQVLSGFKIEIAATAKDQKSFGDRFGHPDSMAIHGILSWNIIHYLKSSAILAGLMHVINNSIKFPD